MKVHRFDIDPGGFATQSSFGHGTDAGLLFQHVPILGRARGGGCGIAALVGRFVLATGQDQKHRHQNA